MTGPSAAWAALQEDVDDWAVRNEWGSPADSLSEIFARHRASIENEARFATPRPGPDSGGCSASGVRRDVPASRQARTGVPCDAEVTPSWATEARAGTVVVRSARHPAPYRMAYPRMAHQVTPEPLPEPRRYDLVAIAVILLVVLAASLADVRP